MPKIRTDADPSVFAPGPPAAEEEPEAPPAEAATSPAAPEPEGASEPAAETGTEEELTPDDLYPPAPSASKADWVAFAVENGMPEQEANEATKAQLIEEFGS